MPKFTIWISIAVLIAGLFLLFDKLFTPQPIQIILQSGQEITTSTSEYFSLAEVLLLIVTAFLIGATSIYLFYNSGQQKKNNAIKDKPEPDEDAYTGIMPLLKADEKRAIEALLGAKGEMHQNKLAAKLNVSKVKATRILHKLELKNLITKERHGFTNMVKLKKVV